MQPVLVLTMETQMICPMLMTVTRRTGRPTESSFRTSLCGVTTSCLVLEARNAAGTNRYEQDEDGADVDEALDFDDEDEDERDAQETEADDAEDISEGDVDGGAGHDEL